MPTGLKAIRKSIAQSKKIPKTFTHNHKRYRVVFVSNRHDEARKAVGMYDNKIVLVKFNRPSERWLVGVR